MEFISISTVPVPLEEELEQIDRNMEVLRYRMEAFWAKMARKEQALHEAEQKARRARIARILARMRENTRLMDEAQAGQATAQSAVCVPAVAGTEGGAWQCQVYRWPHKRPMKRPPR